MRKRMVLILILILFLISFAFYYYTKSRNGISDVYFKGLAYKRSDSSLFSGNFKYIIGNDFLIMSFCKGMPCGKLYQSERNGHEIIEGQYIDLKKSLSDESMKIIGSDTVYFEFWHKGEGNSNNDLRINILKEGLDENRDTTRYNDFSRGLAKSVMKDLNYTSIQVMIRNSVFYHYVSLYYEYHLLGDSLIKTY